MPATCCCCQPSGNRVLFTNYDGGVLNIDVDVDVPDLRIGVVAYNAVRIAITGAFAANVAQVAYAGVNADAGDYCGDGPVTTTMVTGVSTGDVSVSVAPASVLANSFGHQHGDFDEAARPRNHCVQLTPSDIHRCLGVFVIDKEARLVDGVTGIGQG